MLNQIVEFQTWYEISLHYTRKLSSFHDVTIAKLKVVFTENSIFIIILILVSDRNCPNIQQLSKMI